MNEANQSLMKKMEFHEKRMNKKELPQQYRDLSEQMYWLYLDLLTKPDEK